MHDSPDYYQLKLSVFHDDKKTDLIGESWIDLKDIVVPGGNQNDLWHNLSCRGKYAGEIRIELTYYDSRPKPEKPALKTKPKSAEVEAPQKVRGPVKRRPLPTDPVAAATGASQPAVDDLHPKEVVQPAAPAGPEPPRQQQKGPVAYVPTQSPLPNVEYGNPGSQRQAPPEGYVPATQPPAPAPGPSFAAPPPVQHETPPRSSRRHTEQYTPSPHQIEDRGYSPKYPVQHHDQQDTRSQYSSAPEPYQQPMIDDQKFQLPPDDERPPPPPAHRSRTSSSQDLVMRGSFDTTPQKGTPPMRHDVLRNEAHRNSVSSQSRPAYRAFDGSSVPPHQPNGDMYGTSPSRNHSLDATFDPHDPHFRQMQPTIEDAPESPTSARPLGYRMSDVPGRTSHAPHDTVYEENPAPAPLNLSGHGCTSSGQFSLPPIPPHTSQLENNGYGPPSSGDHQFAPDGPPPPPPAHHPATLEQSSDSRALARRSPSMDYVNEAPDNSPPTPPSHGSGYHSHSPTFSASHGHGYREQPGPTPVAHDDASRERSPSFAPSDLSGGHVSSSNLESSEPAASEDPSMNTALVPRKAYNAPQYGGGPNHSELDDTQVARPDNHALQHVPPSLVPGLDPALAREVSERIYEERRNERRQQTQSMATPPRGRDWTEAPARDYVNGGSPHPYAPPQQYHPYDARSSVSFSNAGTPTGARDASKSPNVSPNPSPQPSPNPNHTIKRKSVSPQPPPSQRRSGSEVPYGPDSYEALNPTFSASQSDLALPDPDEKIITHDGKEIDPSDHLPMESWAPEPLPKDKIRSNSDDRGRDRRYSSPRGAQPAPPSGGRRPLRIAGRQQSTAAPTTYTPDELPHTPPGSAGRNRLQKKPNRMPALPSSGSPAGSSPLAPISSHNYKTDSRGYTPPRPSRSSTWDYPSENHAPQYGSSPGGSMRGAPAPPPKIPIPTMSGALVTTGGGDGGGGGGEDWALMEEMSRIDIGAGRSRRHGGR